VNYHVLWPEFHLYVDPARIRSAARHALAMTGPFVLPETNVGMTEQSTTRNPDTP